MKYILTFLLIFSFGCASTNKLDLGSKPYLKDQVSVSTAIRLAHAAYMRGCTQKAKELGESGFYDKCQKLANAYIQSDIISIMDQN